MLRAAGSEAGELPLWVPRAQTSGKPWKAMGAPGISMNPEGLVEDYWVG